MNDIHFIWVHLLFTINHGGMCISSLFMSTDNQVGHTKGNESYIYDAYKFKIMNSISLQSHMAILNHLSFYVKFGMYNITV